MNIQTRTCVILPFLLLAPLLPNEAAVAQDWQERRLFSPSAAQQRAEQRGGVVIYDGLHEDSVDRALDAEFGRVQNMMFVGVRHSAPDDGEYADDDCD